MTEHDKEKIQSLRQRGLGYKAIAAELNVSVNTVKSFLQRNTVENGITAVASDGSPNACKHCGKAIFITVGKRRRQFCSDACRYAHAYRTALSRTAVCDHCGQAFAYHGNADRRFCGHPCYIAHRFAKEEQAR